MTGKMISISGMVVNGRRIGRTIGFPTANLQISSYLGHLEKGVYGAVVHWKNQQFFGVMNIGNRPTFENNEITSYEVHILDFNQDIYNEEIQVNLCFFVRSECAFDNVNDLILQIKHDVEYVKHQFKNKQTLEVS